MTLDVVIVEDEPLARSMIRDFVRGAADLRLAGEAADGETAVEVIGRARPHLLFLDVRLPGVSGLEVLRRVDRGAAVVFTTASAEFAIPALQAGAVDYLVKPFGPASLRAAVERARARVESGGEEPGAPDHLDELARGGPWRRVFVRRGSRRLAVELAAVRRIDAADDYVMLHHGAQHDLLQMTMADIERRLDPRVFVRIHRSHIVNVAFIAEAAPAPGRRLEVILRDGARLPASRAGAPRLRRLLTRRSR